MTHATIWALVFSAVTMALRVPFLWLPFEPTDEGYYASVAQATEKGARLYADLWYVRPPLLNTLYELGYRLSSATGVPYDIAVRLLAGLFAAATVGVLAWLLFETLPVRSALIGSSVAALLGASLALQNEANAETWMMLPYTLSAVLVVYVAVKEPPMRRALWLAVLAGVLTAAAGAFKQVALVNLALPALAWLAFDRARVRRWLGLGAAFVGGALGTWGAVFAAVAVRDDVRAFLYFAWFRNLAYINRSHAGANWLSVLAGRLQGPAIMLTVTAAAGLALAALALLSRTTSPRTRQMAIFALGWLCVSAVGVSASGRYYQHYFIQATVPLALLLAACAETFAEKDAARRLAWVSATGLAAIALAAPAVSWAVDVRRAAAEDADRSVFERLGERLPQLTHPGGSILVWGIRASVRAYCPLPHATRLTVACYDYGWTPISRGQLLGEEFPSTAEVVLGDMQRTAPDLIVVTGPLRQPSEDALRHPNDGVRLTSALYTLVSTRYKVVERGRGYIVLKRMG